MNLKEAELLIACERLGGGSEGKVDKAVRIAERDGTLRERLEAQRKWDRQIFEAVGSIEPPADLRAELNKYGKGRPAPRPMRSQLLQPAMLAVALGLLVLIGLLVFFGMDRVQHFTGREQVSRMLDVTRNMSGVELEPVQGEAWQLGDWFYMRGFESYAVPAEVSKLPAVGSRVFRQGGQPVAQVAIDESNLLVFVFRASDFGVQLEESNDWRYLEHEGWAAAVRRQGSTCTMLAMRGPRSELKTVVNKLRNQ